MKQIAKSSANVENACVSENFFVLFKNQKEFFRPVSNIYSMKIPEGDEDCGS